MEKPFYFRVHVKKEGYELYCVEGYETEEEARRAAQSGEYEFIEDETDYTDVDWDTAICVGCSVCANALLPPSHLVKEPFCRCTKKNLWISINDGGGCALFQPQVGKR